MKKIILIFILIFIYIIIITKKVQQTFIEKIDFKLKEDETVLLFIRNDNKAIYLSNNNNLLLLEYKNDKVLNNLNMIGIKKINNLILLNDVETKISKENKYVLNKNLNINNLDINRKDNIIELKYNNYKLCIYDKGNNKKLSDCDFVYMLDIDNDVLLNDNILAVFYDEKIGDKYLEKYYELWVDSYIIDSKSYVFIKFSKEDYEIITIPFEN